MLAKYAKHLCDLLQQRCEMHPTQTGLRRNPEARKAQSFEWQMESGKAVNPQGDALSPTCLRPACGGDRPTSGLNP